jgi:hypothetical protein
VYDLRRYNESNMWGPFLDDGRASVDWERIEAIMVGVFVFLLFGRGSFWEKVPRKAERGLWNVMLILGIDCTGT